MPFGCPLSYLSHHQSRCNTEGLPDQLDQLQSADLLECGRTAGRIELPDHGHPTHADKRGQVHHELSLWIRLETVAPHRQGEEFQPVWVVADLRDCGDGFEGDNVGGTPSGKRGQTGGGDEVDGVAS